MEEYRPEDEIPAAPAAPLTPEMIARHKAYWRANVTLITVLLVIWALVSLGAGVLFVEPLNKLQLGGVPFGFWMAQQGSIYVFVVLIAVYAFMMDRIEHKYRIDTERTAHDR